MPARWSSATPTPGSWCVSQGRRRIPTGQRWTHRPGGRPGSRPRSVRSVPGGSREVDAVAVGGQQHGMVCLDKHGAVVRPALLWRSIGTSGVVCAVAPTPTADPTGLVTGFASATGDFSPSCARSTGCGCSTRRRGCSTSATNGSQLALDTPAGDDGLVLVPYFQGEASPDLPIAAGALHGLRLEDTPPLTSREPPSRACCAGWPTPSMR